MRPIQHLALTGSIVVLLTLATGAVLTFGPPPIAQASAAGELPDAQASGSENKAPSGPINRPQGFADEPDPSQWGGPTPPPTTPLCFWSDQGPACVERSLPTVGIAAEGDGSTRGVVLLRALLAGPTAQERAQGLTTAFPAGTRLAGFRLEPDRKAVVQLEVPPEALSPLDPAAFEAMVWQLAGTLEPLGWRDLRVQTRDPASGAFVPMEAFLPEMPVPRKEWVSDEGPSVAAAAVPAAAATPAPPLGGLKGKTVYLSAGHGWLWNSNFSRWRTQRPPYPTAPYVGPIIEDHHNAEAVNQYLIRYLQNAGATVIPVRERDMNRAAVVVDNDTPGGGYAETGTWVTSNLTGYLGTTYRYTTTVTGTATATATWTFAVPADGEYAVYAWYRQGTNRAPDARYTVHHAGGETEVAVDQRVHGNTWHYLGTFGFRAGKVFTVTLSNRSAYTGRAVIADAIRVGGGVFSSLTGIYTTTAPYAPNKPWWEVAAYYHVQRMGLNPSGWPSYGYFNDVVARPMYARWEHAGTGDDALYISWHSNGTSSSGYQTTTRGTVTFIYNGQSVTPGSAQLQDAVHTEIIRALRTAWDPAWPDLGKRALNLGELRELWDPDPTVQMPGVLIEVAFHDHPTDTDALKEPKFNQLVARAVYRGIVRYFETRDRVDLPLLPEPPTHLAVQNLGDGQVQVSWRPPATNTPGLESDPPTGYRVYTSTDGVGWSATALVTTTVYTLTGVPAGELLFVRVTAVNDGGESFPTEVLGVRTPPSVRSEAAGGGMSALLVNGFDRLNRTMLIPETDPVEGFNLRMFLDRMNARNYVLQHGRALSLPFDSASNEAVRDGPISLADYALVDWILGEESASDQTLDPTERALLRAYLDGCGALFISGTELGWHLDAPGADPDFYRNVLRARYVADDAGTYMVTPTAGSTFAGLPPFRFDAPGMYDPDFPDVISPTAGSVAALAYVGGMGGTAAIQYTDGCRRLVYFAFPLETIDPSARAAVMERVLDFLTNEPSGIRHQVFLPLVLRDFGSSPSPVIINGGFETDEGWTLNRLAIYDASLARSGARSMRLGILPGEPVSQTIFSSVSQSFVVPGGPTVTLSLWVYLRTEGDRDDLFYISLYDGNGQYRPLDSWRPGDLPENTWVERRVDLTPYAGQRVTLYIGVKNDGDNLPAAMNGDDVGIQ